MSASAARDMVTVGRATEPRACEVHCGSARIAHNAWPTPRWGATGLWAVVLVLALTCPCHALTRADLLFYAPFEGSPDAVISGGDGRATVATPPRYGPGVIGQAVQAGDPAAQIRYAIPGNIYDRAGAISVWIKPVDWRSGDARQHCIIRIAGRMLIYHYWEGGTLGMWWMSGSNILWGSGWWYPTLTPDAWQHIAFSWGDGKCTGYANGRQVTEGVDMPDDLPAWLDGSSLELAEPSWTGDASNRTWMDELMIFGRPLSPAEVRALYCRGSVPQVPPVLAVVRTSSPPAVDGAVSPGEWEDAAGVADLVDGVFGLLCERPLQARCTYDDRGLYVAVEGAPGDEADVANGLEVWAKAPGDNGEATYLRIPARGEATLNGAPLTPPARAAVGHAWGPDGPGLSFEVFLPWAAAGLNAPGSGSECRLQLVRRWSSRHGDCASWADPPVQAETPGAWGTLTFADEGPALAVDRLGRLGYAQLDLAGRVLAGTGDPQTLQAQVRLQAADIQEVVDPETLIRTWTGPQINLDRALQVRGAAEPFRISATFSDLEINSLWLEVSAGERTLYRARRLFVPAPPIVATVRLYPSSDRAEVHADVSSYREAPLGDLSAQVDLIDETGRLLDSRLIPRFTSPVEAVVFPLAPLPVGTVHVRATLLRGEASISSFDTTFEQIAPGPWKGNQLGRDDIVIPPFTPVLVEGQSVSVWGRTYQWSDSLFPVQITSAGQELLAAPVELLAGGEPTGAPNPARVRVVSHRDTEAVVECVGTLGPASVRALHRIEYDGMCLTQLQVSGPPGAALDGLSLLIPMNPAQSTLYHHFCNGGTVRGSENVGRGRGLQGKAEWEWLHTLWLGNEDRGLTWFAEDPEGWRLEASDKAVALTTDEAQTRLSLRFCSGRFSLTQPLELTFGLIATPVKELPANARFIRLRRDFSYAWCGPGSFTQSNNDITHVLPGWRELHAREAQRYGFFVPYQRPDWINLREPEAAYYREEWQTVPPYVSGSDDGSDHRHLSVCLGSEWADFMLYYAVKAYVENEMTGFYFDGGLPTSCNNTVHGHGYLMPSGKIGPTYPMLAFRDFYKRLATELHKQGRPYLIWVHASNCLEMPTLSFVNMVWDGEQFSVAASKARDYTRLMTLSYFRAEFLGQQFGIPVQWLVEFFDRPGEPDIGEKEADTMLALALVHGVADRTLASNLAGTDAYVLRVLEAQDAFGIREPDCRFLPYWSNSRQVALEPAGDFSACSLWLRPGKALVILANCSEKEQQMTARLNLAELGLAGPLTGADLMTGEAVPVPEGVLGLTVPAASWRAVVVQSK